MNRADLEADLCYSIGRCYTASGNTSQASEYLNEALAFYTSAKDIKGQGNCLYYLGCNQMETELDRAIGSFKKALSLRKQIYGTHHTLISDCYRKMGNTYTRKGDFDTALDYYFGSVNSEKVLIETFPHKSDFHKHRKAVCYYKLGYSKELKGDMKNAEHYYLKALRAFPNSEQQRFPDVLMKLSQFYKATGQLHESEEYFGRAVDWYKNHQQENVAELLQKQGNAEVGEMRDDFEESKTFQSCYFM